MSRVQIIRDLPQTGRVLRKPQHPFHLFHHPFVIQPFMIAPVLPGETLKQALVQSRAVSDPIKNSKIGAWLEHFLFYVPVSAMPNAATIMNMFVDETEAGLAVSTADVKSRYFAWGYDFVNECLQAVTAAYFRQPGVAWNAAGTTIVDHNGETVPIAEINQESWLDSATLSSDLPTAAAGTDEIEGRFDSLDGARVKFEQLKQLGFTAMTFDDYLRMEGIDVPEAEAEQSEQPELLRFNREWVPPANTVDASTGVPTSAYSWQVAFRADKDRFFKRPGFVFGVTIMRPKVYLSRQYGTASSQLRFLRSWLPKEAAEGAEAVYEYANTAGVLSTGTADATSPSGNIVVDLRDLLVYGEQFHNIAAADQAGCNFVALPSTNLQKRYVSLADINGFFPGATAATRLIRQDGIAHLNVLGRQTDQTRTTNHG